MGNVYLKDKYEQKKWKNELTRPRPKYYFIYFIIIICLAYIVDELATYSNSFVQNMVVKDYFGGDISGYTIAFTLCSSISILSFIYKTLADKYGRKMFLIINVICMGLGMFICFLSRHAWSYIIGLTITCFFTPCDIHIVYVVETASDKHRAFWLSFNKAVAVASLALIPIFSKVINNQGWQVIFLIPAIIGLVVGLLSLFFIRESEPFMRNRIATIKQKRKLEANPLSEEEIRKQKVLQAQGGLISAFKYIFINKHLIWVFFVGIVFSMCSLGATNFSVIIDQSTSITESQYLLALHIYPVICALFEIIVGLISDKMGRKKATVTAGTFAVIGIIYFIISVICNWHTQFIGIFLGIFMAGYLAGIDTFTLMCAEQSPTNLRTSVVSIMSVSLSIGSFISTGILLLCNKVVPELNVGFLCLCVICPTLFIGLLILISKMPETRDNDLYDISKKIVRKRKSKTPQLETTTEDSESSEINNINNNQSNSDN